MVDSDYQMAMLLQQQFEFEQKQNQHKPQHYSEDYFLALTLQQQFEQEISVEKPKDNLVYENKKKHQSTDPSKSLIDPSWEIVDPTPDIHGLFMAFNDRFFWGKLLAVCVDWSKRMTTCAGICSYAGRGGMCKITLSEPLLKLRPRKDLVETLLHEMIHAYLFVTHNNKDRDGHGPEFHKHMYRINKETGTNITVYHSFHDEVRLYQQHWWRCDGPCQHRKPFFGMVRRAMNRAPGPNDFWWADHLRTCGGTFIKVKEPEKSKKRKSQKENVPTAPKKTKNDIRNYISVLGDQNRDRAKDVPSTSAVSKPNSNIHGFSIATKETEPKKVTKIFTGAVQTLGGDKPAPKDYSIVRNHWLNKFNNTTTNTKRTSPNSANNDNKRPRLTATSTQQTQVVSDDSVPCPVCQKHFPTRDINDHLDLCLTKETAQPETKIERSNNVDDYDKPGTSSSTNVNPEDDDVMIVEDNKNESIQFVFETSNEEESDENMYACPFCMEMFAEEDMNAHLDDCLVAEDDGESFNKSIAIDEIVNNDF